MLEWIAEQILTAFNSIPEWFLAQDDPRFDFLRWWIVFVVFVIFVVIGRMAYRAVRQNQRPLGA
jgi:hypothetical protein